MGLMRNRLLRAAVTGRRGGPVTPRGLVNYLLVAGGSGYDTNAGTTGLGGAAVQGETILAVGSYPVQVGARAAGVNVPGSPASAFGYSAAGTSPAGGVASTISGLSLQYGVKGGGDDNRGGGQGETGFAGIGPVIISYPTGSMTATGGSVTTSGGRTIHTFTAGGTFSRSA